ncbi:unnamed protein product [Heligmosomoides polygyrus]|uniref:FABP domain-containing protein n=1 Tax=Heligmosomoides polygyrus TaxID=6339 RepID=A0A183G0D3_HELPZ|nr:unnamed protein product [Heligmosomoides polygyrus]
MEPKKNANVNDEAPSWLMPALKRWDEYFERFDKIFEVFVKMQGLQAAIFKRLDALENKLVSEPQRDSDPRSALYSTLVKFKTDSKIVDAKTCRITWVGVGEQNTEVATYAFDREAIKEVVETSGDELLLSEFNSGKITFHMHSKVRRQAASSRPRIIKIYLGNQDLRDRMLEHM